MSLAVLFEDNHCLAVCKPAGQPTLSDASGDAALHAQACEYLREKYHKPGQVFLGVLHRLDRPVSGVVLFARTSKAAARLAEQFRTGRVQKVYLALVEGRLTPREGLCTDWLLKDEARNHTRRVPPDTPGAKECRLRYREVACVPQTIPHTAVPLQSGWSLVEVQPETGRSHQIRVQLAVQAPIVGDVRYGSQIRLGPALCLHALRLTFLHPITRQPVTVTAAPPDWAAWAA